MEELSFTQTFTCSFYNHDYLITVRVHNSRLYIEVQDKYEGLRWTGTFMSEYIEDITRKAKSFRKFPVFIQMLMQALRKESQIVYIDLLTMQELLLLKASKLGGSTDPRSINASKITNKRYLILTHVAEFDHVHYPLNLCFDDAPAVGILQRTISRLSTQLSNFKALSQSDMSSMNHGTQSEFFAQTNSFEIMSVMSENENLKKEIKRLEVDSDDQESNDEFQEKLRIKMEIHKQAQQLKEDYAAMTRELEAHNKKIDQKKMELRMTKTKYNSIKNNEEFSSQATLKKQLEEMKEKLQEEKSMGGKALKEQEEEQEKLEKELEEAKESELKMKTRMKELENEIKTANGKIDELTMGYRRSTRSSSYQRSPAASSQKSRNSSAKASPAGYRSSYNRPINLKNYTPPGARQPVARAPLYRRSSPGQASGSLNRNGNSQSKYSPGAWRQQNKQSASPAAARGLASSNRRPTNGGGQAGSSPGGSTVFDRLYAKSRRNLSKEPSPGAASRYQTRGRSKDPSPQRFASNKDIKPMLSQKVLGTGVLLNNENKRPNVGGGGGSGVAGVAGVGGKGAVDIQGINSRIEDLQKMIAQSKGGA